MTVKQQLLRYFDIDWLSRHDGPGARVVLFLQGCNLACPWCHSPHSRFAESPILFFRGRCLTCDRCRDVCPAGLRGASPDLRNVTVLCRRCGACVAACPVSRPDAMTGALALPTRKAVPEDLFAALKPQLEIVRQIGGLTISGGEALLQVAAVTRLLELAKGDGFHTTVETSGLLPRHHYETVAGLVDCWLFGLRSDIPGAGVNEGFGARRENLSFLASLQTRVIIRKPLLTGLTDTGEEIDATIGLMNECGLTEIEVLPLNPHTGHYYQALGMECPTVDNQMPTTDAVASLRDRFVECGFTVNPG